MKTSVISGDAPVQQGVTVQDPAAVYRRLLGYAKHHWVMFIWASIGMLLFALSDASLAWFAKSFLTVVYESKDPRALWAVPLGAVTLFFVRGCADYMSNYFPGWIGRQIIKTVRGELFAHYVRLPARYYDQTSSAEMLSRLTYNVEQMAEAATKSVTVLIRDTLTIIALLGTAFYFNWRLAVSGLIIAPLMGWLIQFINRSYRRYAGRIQNSMGDVTRVAKEALEGHRLVKVFNAQQYEEKVFDVANERNRHSNMRMIATQATSNPVTQFVAAIALSAVLYLALSQAFRGEMGFPTFVGFLTAFLMITAPLRRLVGVFGPLQQGIAAGASVFSVLDLPAEADGGKRPLERAHGEVEFRDVSFVYTEEKGKVLHAVNLHVPVGKTVAIVGRSGSGKSTLVSLVPRFYDPDVGQVLLDGVDVREFSLVDLRRQVSLVSQEVVLFNDTIRANIAFSMTDAAPGAIEAAARAAYVLDFAQKFPQGLDTPIGDRGVLLSGGERQRISIARALLKNSPVLILDEATSALDTESERHIQAALDELIRNRTTLVIAHRLSTIESADLIVVMQDGAIVERGTHAELLAKDGAYAQLHRLQFNA